MSNPNPLGVSLTQGIQTKQTGWPITVDSPVLSIMYSPLIIVCGHQGGYDKRRILRITI